MEKKEMKKKVQAKTGEKAKGKGKTAQVPATPKAIVKKGKTSVKINLKASTFFQKKVHKGDNLKWKKRQEKGSLNKSQVFDTVNKNNNEQAIILGTTCVQEGAYLAKKWSLLNGKKVKDSKKRKVYLENSRNSRIWKGQKVWEIDQKFAYSLGNNETLEGIEQSDLIIVVGTHVRKEAALINARILKTMRQSPKCKVCWLGSPRKTNYPVEWGGITADEYQKLGEGKHIWCKEIQQAKNPWLLIGAPLWERSEGAFYKQVTKVIQKQKQNLQVGFIHTGPNHVGLYDAGIQETYNLYTQNQPTSSRLWVLPEHLQGVQTTQSDVIFSPYVREKKKAEHGFFLPGSAWCEKEGTWRNWEGRVQSLKPSVKPYLDSKDEVLFLGTWFMYLKETWITQKKVYLQQYNEQNPSSSLIYSSTLKESDSWLKAFSQKLIYEKGCASLAPLRTWIDMYYQTDALTEQSKILSECNRTLEDTPPGSERKTLGLSFVL